ACQGQTVQDADQRLLALVRQLRSQWSDPFVVHLLQALRDHGPEACNGIDWLERHLARRHDTSTDVLRREHQRQAATQVSVGNCVTSLRLLTVLDWTVFFERTSRVEAELCHDPAGVYAHQDSTTKDRYRQVVERLARGSAYDELAIARQAVRLARRQEVRASSTTSLTAGPRVARSHCGYYFIGPGRVELEA